MEEKKDTDEEAEQSGSIRGGKMGPLLEILPTAQGRIRLLICFVSL